MGRPDAYTREANRKSWGQILVAHPERVDDVLLDVDLVNARRNVESFLSLVRCGITCPGGLRRRLILAERWQTVQVPTLFLWGERDAFAPPSAAEAIVARNPHLRLVRIPDAGHLPWIDHPEEVVREIEQFVAA
jgi:pimeloyl-ACP methyl ester carboxylesterase